jgi:hypothetical protein
MTNAVSAKLAYRPLTDARDSVTCCESTARSEQEWGRIVRYIESNPVVAGLAARPEDYRWSSTASLIANRRQDCRRGTHDCALHIRLGTSSEMRKLQTRK